MTPRGQLTPGPISPQPSLRRMLRMILGGDRGGGSHEQARTVRARRGAPAEPLAQPFPSNLHPCGARELHPRFRLSGAAIRPPRQLSTHHPGIHLAVRADAVVRLHRGAPRRRRRGASRRALRHPRPHHRGDHHRGLAHHLDHLAWRERPDARPRRHVCHLNDRAERHDWHGAAHGGCAIGNRNTISKARAPFWWSSPRSPCLR